MCIQIPDFLNVHGGELSAAEIMGKTIFISILTLCGFLIPGYTQNLWINEVQSSNTATMYDHTGDTPDWIELFNSGAQDINLENYGLSDRHDNPYKWTFPRVSIAPNGYLLIFASGLDLKDPVLQWHTLIDKGDTWKYLVPTSEIAPSWRGKGFDDSHWQEGPSGFGYGDDDDATIIGSAMSVFIRKTLTIDNPQNTSQAYLHIDFDDAFIAYINGVEIARSNIGKPGDPVSWNAPADNYDHEAKMYQGGYPDAFLIDNISEYLSEGENVLAIQVHNHSLGSSDLTAIPFFTLGYVQHPGFETTVSSLINFVPVGLHTNFSIAADGEDLILTDPSGATVDSVYTSRLTVNISLGRKPDGSPHWRLFNEPTPGKSNSTPGYDTLQLPAVNFSHQGGKYSGSISLQLSTENPNDSIFYTTDGSEPTVNSPYFTGPIFMNMPRTVRARVIKSGYLPGQVTSNSYLMNTNHALPAIFVSTDPANLWDNEYGIYVKGRNASSEYPYFGANFWEDWEKPANIIMYERDGRRAFHLDAGIKIFGAWSRGQDQKSLSIHTRRSYGYDGINYRIFAEKPIERFETIVLRNSGNDFNNTMIRDAYCNRITSSLGLDQQAYRPAVVYINGDYWGIQNIREKVNEEFIASNHDVDEDLVDILEGDGEVVRGSSDHYEALKAYIQSNNLAIDQHYNYVKTQMDVQNFINYQIAQIFIDNRDWPGNNIKFWRERNASPKWKWIMFDSDFGINTWANDNQTFNTLQFALEPNGPGWPNPPWSTFLLRNLIRNTSFKHDFINAFADHLNTIFDPAVLSGHLNDMIKEIESEIPAHMQRWNGNTWYWNDRINAMRTFIRDRRNLVRNHIRGVFGIAGTFNLNINTEGQGYVKLNTIHINNFPWSGQYFDNIPVELEAIPAPGYRFVQWKDAENKTSESISVNTADNTSLTAVFQILPESNLKIVINEINYRSADDFDVGDWIELLNISGYTINMSGWELKDDNDDHVFVFPENTIIPADGFLVIVRDRTKFKAGFPEVEIVDGELDFGLGGDEDCVRLTTNEGVLVDEVCYKKSAPWPPGANGAGGTLALKNPFSNNEHPLNWEASESYGTPGRSNFDVITGITQHRTAFNGLRIFPNPAKSNAVLGFESQTDGFMQVYIMDLAGRKHRLFSNQPVVSGTNIIELDFNQLKSSIRPGLYVIQLESSGTTNHIKVIIED